MAGRSRDVRVDRTFTLDAERYCESEFGDPRSTSSRMARLLLLDLDFRAVACFRFRQWAGSVWAENKVRGLVPMLLAGAWRRRMVVVHHAEIDRDAVIGPGLRIMHRSGLFLGPVTIGANCVLHHNTTIGQRVADNDKRVPAIGDDVWIGPGVTITGGIVIGDRSTISAGSVVTRDVPAGALVAGNPGRVVRADYDNSALLNHRVYQEAAST